uniref:Putative imidazole glycerol phosphate synthase subunit n=1 Tax=termite gut metagenome TaxID=433724 RepID=S0DDB6_9ZZZZ
MIAIVNYGVGNLFSLSSSLGVLGIEAAVTGDAAAIRAADGIILPGVGAFGDAMHKLRQTGLDAVLVQQARAGKPLLGICLGMQLLFQQSFEFGRHAGLGLIPGDICPLRDDLDALGPQYADYKVPHMGWNSLQFTDKTCPLLQNTAEGAYVYYVHSFYAQNCAQHVAADSEYGVRVPGVVQNGSVFGTQFHPEKSGDVGLGILKAYAKVVG